MDGVVIYCALVIIFLIWLHILAYDVPLWYGNLIKLLAQNKEKNSYNSDQRCKFHNSLSIFSKMSEDKNLERSKVTLPRVRILEIFESSPKAP